MATLRSNISPRGTLKNLLSMGFTDQHAVHELADNSFDAGARNVRIRLDTSTKTLYIDDDGVGMDLAQLTDALRLNNVRPASDHIGLRGIGAKAGQCVLTNEDFASCILSKTASSSRCEIDADWPAALRDDVWDPRASRGSEEYRHLWESGCLNPAHGTTMRIPMPETKFKDMVDSMPSFMRELTRTYESFLNSGKMIRVEVDGVVQPLDWSSCISWDSTSDHLRNEVTMVVLHNRATGETRVYYKHTNNSPAWTEMVRLNPVADATPEYVRDYQVAVADGFTETTRMVLRSTYNQEWNPPEGDAGARLPYTPGYYTVIRNMRALQPITTEFASSGDFERRRLVASCRHALECSDSADNLVGIQVNKSALTPESIHPLLLATVKFLAKKWAEKTYKTHYKVAVQALNANFTRGLNRRIRQIRELANANQEAFLVEFDEILEELRDRLNENPRHGGEDA